MDKLHPEAEREALVLFSLLRELQERADMLSSNQKVILRDNLVQRLYDILDVGATKIPISQEQAEKLAPIIRDWPTDSKVRLSHFFNIDQIQDYLVVWHDYS